MGGAHAILATAPDGSAMGSLIAGPAVRGKLIVVGVSGDPIAVSTLPLVFGGRSIHGSLTGTAIDNQDTLDFSVLQNVRPTIEVMPLERAVEAYARMMDGKARFRMVLSIAPQDRSFEWRPFRRCRPSHHVDPAVLRLPDEEGAHHQAHSGDDDRVPEARIDVSAGGDDGRGDERQHAPEPPVPDVVRK
jgi:hypothetical protein